MKKQRRANRRRAMRFAKKCGWIVRNGDWYTCLHSASGAWHELCISKGRWELHFRFADHTRTFRGLVSAVRYARRALGGVAGQWGPDAVSWATCSDGHKMLIALAKFAKPEDHGKIVDIASKCVALVAHYQDDPDNYAKLARCEALDAAALPMPRAAIAASRAAWYASAAAQSAARRGEDGFGASEAIGYECAVIVRDHFPSDPAPRKGQNWIRL